MNATTATKKIALATLATATASYSTVEADSTGLFDDGIVR